MHVAMDSLARFSCRTSFFPKLVSRDHFFRKAVKENIQEIQRHQHFVMDETQKKYTYIRTEDREKEGERPKVNQNFETFSQYAVGMVKVLNVLDALTSLVKHM